VAGVPWLAYIPIPGLHLAATWAAPTDPLTRFHARQGGFLILTLYLWLLIVGFATSMSDSPAFLAAMGLLAGIPLFAALVAMIVGIAAAAMGRYARLRPIWDILAASGR
jgi:hypothetical protein